MTNNTLLGLDVGTVRIGVALARLDVRLPQPLTTVAAGAGAFEAIAGLVTQHESIGVVVGWPRGLEGQTTDQTKMVESFVNELRQQVTVPVYLQDEALTSRKAEAELDSRKKPYAKGDVDALAATYILDDYMQSHILSEASHV